MYYLNKKWVLMVNSFSAKDEVAVNVLLRLVHVKIMMMMVVLRKAK